jgi:neopullulanase
MHALPKFNTDNPEVREFLMGIAEHWLRAGIDGWRLDVPLEIKTDGFWEEFRSRVRAINPEAYIVAEIWHPATEWIGADPVFDGVMNYQLTEAVLRFTAGHRIDAEVTEPVNLTLAPGFDAPGFGRALDELQALYPREAHRANLNLLGSHDTPRVLSIVGEDVASEALAAAILFTLPGAPCIYYGDEIGMTGHHDPYSRGAFPWDNPDTWNRDLMEVYRSLGMLRRSEPALRQGTYRTLWAEGGLFAFAREFADDHLAVAVNAGEEDAVALLDMPAGALQRRWGSGEADYAEGRLRVKVAPRSAAVWRIR